MGKDYVPYWEKLKDPRWQKRRLEIIERDSSMCQSCYRDDVTLNVHHIVYEPRRDPWDYEDRYLTTFCQPCHERWHELQKQMLLIIGTTNLDRLEEVLGYVKAAFSSHIGCPTEHRSFQINSANEFWGAYARIFTPMTPESLERPSEFPVTTNDIRRMAVELFPSFFREYQKD